MLATMLKGAAKGSTPFTKTPITIADPNAYGTAANDYFGYNVSISPSYVLIGAPQENDASGNYSGKAYLFDANTGTLLKTINNPNAYGTATNDFFGRRIDHTDSMAIIGAYNESDAGGTTSGKAYIFSIPSGTLIATLNNPNVTGTSANDYFGYAVGISGNYVAVSAYQEDLNGTDSGVVYVFNATTGARLQTIANPNAYGTSTSDYFGFSIAIDGNYLIVGAYQEDDAGGTSSGKAYIFDVTTGTLIMTLNNPNAYGPSKNDYFGYAVAIDGNYAIVGAYGESDSGGNVSGKAYIFNILTGALITTITNPNAYGPSKNDYFGYAVAIDGNYAIVGAYQEDDAGGTSSGKAYIFNISTGALLKTLDNPNVYGTSANDFFGWSVDISNKRAIVGAYQEDIAGYNNTGKAYLYT